MTDWPNHQIPWREWRAALGGERMHHGWVLAGKKGLGKHDFAHVAARELVAEEGIPQPTGDHPDILVLSHLPKDDKEQKKRDEGKSYETKRNISVAQIREMQRRLTTRPTLGSRRAIVIDPADDLETSASNALLKSLEEPPQGTFFLLVTHRPSRLLPTIRSRCRILRFPLVEAGDMTELLTRAHSELPREAIEAARLAAGGSPGAAMRFIEQDLAAVAALIHKLLTDGDPQFVHRGSLTQLLGGKVNRERTQAVLELAQAITAEAARTAAPKARPGLIECYQELVALSGQAPTFNFDSSLLAMEIGTLLASAAPASERANV